MYPVSEAFLHAVQENTRKYYWTGRIITKTGQSMNLEMRILSRVLALCCKACDVELVHTQAEIEAMSNGSEMLSVYGKLFQMGMCQTVNRHLYDVSRLQRHCFSDCQRSFPILTALLKEPPPFRINSFKWYSHLT